MDHVISSYITCGSECLYELGLGIGHFVGAMTLLMAGNCHGNVHS